MEKIYTQIKGRSELLHMVYFPSDFELENVDRRVELVEPDQYIQCAALTMQHGKRFRPHKHVWKTVEKTLVIAQESWVVMRGEVLVSFYDIDGSWIKDVSMKEGCCSFTLQGGHTYEILRDDTFVYEFKTGPYTGQANDKVFI